MKYLQLISYDCLNLRTFRKGILFLFFIALHSISYSQTSTLTVIVVDFGESPIQYANISIRQSSDPSKVDVGMTDENGRYDIKLKKNNLYRISIQFPGFERILDSLKLDSSITKEYHLREQTIALPEITVSASVPIQVKGDTVVFDANSFADGKENKLKEIIKKIPGLEIDREGNTTFKGKAVSRITVDGKSFFTGNTKLGVNYIPADVVDKIEIIEKDVDAGFMKSFQQSDRISMNIKLKENKKKFIFGDLLAGIGLNHRYSVQPTIFSYAPSTRVNLISDVNNIGQRAFTFSDYLEFEGGASKIIDNPVALKSLFRDISSYFQSDNFIMNKSRFGAIHLSQQITPKFEVSAFSINNHNSISQQSLNKSSILLVNNEIPLEHRNSYSSKITPSSINKIEFTYLPKYNSEIKYLLSYRKTKNNNSDSIISMTTGGNNRIYFDQILQNRELSHFISWNEKRNHRNAFTIVANLKNRSTDGSPIIKTTKPINSSIIEWRGAEPYQMSENNVLTNFQLEVGGKYIWKIDDLNHIHFKINHFQLDQNYINTAFQLTQDSLISLSKYGIGNNTHFNLVDPSFGSIYYSKWGKWQGVFGVIGHNYRWKVSQMKIESIDAQKYQFFPEMKFTKNISESQSFEIGYNISSNFEEVKSYTSNFSLDGINGLYSPSSWCLMGSI